MSYVGRRFRYRSAFSNPEVVVNMLINQLHAAPKTPLRAVPRYDRVQPKQYRNIEEILTAFGKYLPAGLQSLPAVLRFRDDPNKMLELVRGNKPWHVNGREYDH